jgi:beta-galactosidase
VNTDGRGERLAHLRRLVPGIAFGGDYNPEQWPPATWDADMALMRDARVTMVTLGIFSWAQVEPRPGEFAFGWLDEVMDKLAENGVSVSLATMTASPPPWLARLHPETLPMRADGVRLWPGSRQHYCPSSPVYRHHATRLVEQVAGRYGEHPALALWHIGNEYGCHVSDCYCDVSADAFRHWLAERYGSIEALNEAWSTAFWSQRYDDWSEIVPPRAAPSIPNPAQQIDYRRFSSDELLACYLLEREICARLTPDVPVTTNLLSVWKPVDYFAWAPHLDVISHDSYPDPLDPRTHVEVAFAYDLMRSLGEGAPWLLLEQAPSAVNWRPVNPPKPPGVMRLWSYQAVARGADAILYFQWRQSHGGAEKYHSAMVPHGGTSVRTYREIRELGAELGRLDEVAGSTIEADVALVLDWPSWWGLELGSHPSTALTQRDTSLSHYAPLWDEHVTADVVSPSFDLSRYRLVVVPSLYLVSAEAAANLCDYVRGGGHLVMSFFSGIVDEHDRVYPGGYPGPFRELLGLRIDEFWPLPERGEIRLAFVDGTAARGSVWSEWIEVEDAEVVATFSDGVLSGRPAMTRRTFGDGVAWYLGTRLDAESMRHLVRRVLEEAGIRPPLPRVPDGVEAVVRHGKEARYLFLLNHTEVEISVTAPDRSEALIGAVVSGSVTLAPHDLALLKTPSKEDAAGIP